METVITDEVKQRLFSRAYALYKSSIECPCGTREYPYRDRYYEGACMMLKELGLFGEYCSWLSSLYKTE